jgi:hypothetical protein
VIVPEEQVTVRPEVIDVEPMMMSVPEVPTVRPETMAVPELFRSSAKAAVPVADAVALKGVPESVNTLPDTVPAVALRVKVAKTPVAPLRLAVPTTSEPATADPVEAAAVLPLIRSATSCMRLVFSVAE